MRTRRMTTERLKASIKYRSRLLSRALAEKTLTTALKICRKLGTGDAPLRKGLWTMNRTYRSASERENGRRNFKDILSRIAIGDAVEPDELLPYLWAEELQQRVEVNAMLADAYFQSQTEASLKQALVFIKRAWTLSGGAPDLLPLYINIFS